MLGEDYLYMKKVPAEAKHQARIDTFGGTWTQFDVSIHIHTESQLKKKY